MNMWVQRKSIVSGLLLCLIAESVAFAEPHGASDTIQAIQFELAADHLQQFGFNLQASALAARVRGNLTEWEYPLPAAGPYSHRLQAAVGKIVHGDTPVGLSFSSGNSDPRATDFQKADVLPVTCVFRSLDTDAIIAEAKSTFSARPLLGEYGETRIADKLVDQIGTACLNLLEDLPRPQTLKRATSSTFKPKWMPDVRVEVKETPLPASGENAAGSTQDANNVEVKKEIIIHNQGTPVIFTFGHERR